MLFVRFLLYIWCLLFCVCSGLHLKLAIFHPHLEICLERDQGRPRLLPILHLNKRVLHPTISVPIYKIRTG